MSYPAWKPYVRAAERKRQAESATARARKAGAALSPIAPSRGVIAKTFWGKAWCDNLERYSDFANRLPRGRTYLRNGSVIDLVITQGEVRAQVAGSNVYRIEVRVAAVGEKQWKSIGADCGGSIASMVELLQGTLSKGVMHRLCRPGDGLFPAPKEIEFRCSCPDRASMCKHVAAVLYGIGARLDQQPELLFQLRRVDGNELLAQAETSLIRPRTRPANARILEHASLGDVFGIEIVQLPTPREASTKRAFASRRDASSIRREAGAPSAPTAKKPVRVSRQGANDASFPQPIGAVRTTPEAPAQGAAKKKPKRKSPR